MPESDEMHLVDFERFIILGINPLSDSRERATIRRMLKPAGGLTTKDCLAVYRNNITSTRARALQVIYPVCKTILGSNYFHPLAREYPGMPPMIARTSMSMVGSS
jgi:hypothetical protein